MKVALETNAYVALARGETWALEPVRRSESVFLPVVTLAELRAGFLCGKKTENNEKNLTSFLNTPRVAVSEVNEETTHIYARLFTFLRQQGKPIPTNDLWIAALTVQENAQLLTMDQHFDYLPQLSIYK